MFRRHWTLRRQLTILTLLFLGLSAAALGLVIQLFQSLEGTVVVRNQRELASANTRLIQLFWKLQLEPSSVVTKQLKDSLQDVSAEVLASFSRVEGGFYLLQKDQIEGYSFPTHSGPRPKKDVPPAERETILQLNRRATSQGIPQELVLRPRKIDILVLRSDPLPLWGAVWTMKRIPRSEENSQPKILSVLVVLGILGVGIWTFAIALQLQWGVQKLQYSINAIAANQAAEIPPLPAEMGLLGSAINTMQSHRQDLEQRLRRVERLASLGQLVAGVAHEIRNPLASMRLNLQYTERQLQKQGITSLPISSLLEQVDRLEHLVQRLLYFDQQQQEVPSLTSLAAIAGEAVALLRLQAQERRVELVYNLPEEDAEALMPLRSQEIGQVLVNLILNAIQASPAGNRVIVGVKKHYLKRETQNLLNADYCVVWVQDYGAGLSPEEKARIFEPFYSTKPEGTGLGLAISHEIVSRNGGYIDVKSQPGCTQFSVYLPINNQGEA